MNNEFSLSLRNIKKLVNPSGDEHKFNLQKQSSSSASQNGLHVSDYTDKEKSRNNIVVQTNANAQNSLSIDKSSNSQSRMVTHHQQLKSMDQGAKNLTFLNSGQTYTKQLTTKDNASIFNQQTASINLRKLSNGALQHQASSIGGGSTVVSMNEYYDNGETTTTQSITTNTNRKSINMQSNLQQKANENSSMIKVDSMHDVLVKAQQWSASKEKQVKQLAQDQIRKGLIIPNTIQSAQYDVKQQYTSRGNSLTQRSQDLASTSKKKLLDSQRKSEIKQRINDLVQGHGSAFKSESERGSDVKRNLLMKSYSQKSMDSVKKKIRFPIKAEKDDLTQKLLLEMHNEDRQKRLDGAYSSNRSRQNELNLVDTKSRVAFRIRSGNRTGSNRRALQAHTKQQEEQVNSEIVKHMRKGQISQEQDQMKRIQSAYNQKAMASNKLILEKQDSLERYIATESNYEELGYENPKTMQLGRQNSENSQFSQIFQSTQNRLFSLAGIFPKPQQQKNQFNIRPSTSIKQLPSKSGGVIQTLPLRQPIQRKQSIKQHHKIITPPSNIYSQSARFEFQSNSNTQITIDGVKQKLLIDLYEAKCKDLLLKPQKEQEKRFFEFCQKTISNRRIIMRECGLGEASATVLSQIITGYHFSYLDLGKNNLGNAGLNALLKGIKQNCSLIHLDLGSNDITFEGAIKLFKTLENHLTLSSLTLANHDRLHRNRMGFKACEALNSLLQKNQILSQLNISDNAISNEGLRIISNQAFTKESNLVSINMSNNDLQGAVAIQCFFEILSQSKSLIQLNLSDNLIGDQGIDELTKLFTENSSRLNRLILSNICCTSVSVGKLFFALKSNNFMTHLTLDGNDLSAQQFDQISLLLWNNRKLQTLEMRNCNINNYGAECIIDGMSKNNSLQTLDISSNKISQNGAKRWQEVLGRTGLTYLDLSNNQIDDQGVIAIVKGLSFGPSLENKNPLLTHLGLKNVNMKDAGGSALSQMMSSNTNITKISTDSNTVSHKYIEEIQAACLRNKQIQKNNTVPKFKDELGNLIQLTKDYSKQPSTHASSVELPQQLQLKRMNCIRKIKTLHMEKDERVKEIFEGEDEIQDMQDQDEEMHRQFRLIKEQNERILSNLDNELHRLEKKTQNKELYIQEQIEGIDKRMDYVKLKNSRVQKLIDVEHGKIGKEKDKYKDYVKELEDKLEEAEKDCRMAQVLQKTYVDQLEREKNKLLEEMRLNNPGQFNELEGGIGLNILNSLEGSQEIIIRNNEGKICKRKGSKSQLKKKKANKIPKSTATNIGSKKENKDPKDEENQLVMRNNKGSSTKQLISANQYSSGASSSRKSSKNSRVKLN